MCPKGDEESGIKEEEEDLDGLEVAGRSVDASSIGISKHSRSKFGGFSSKRFAVHRTKTIFD